MTTLKLFGIIIITPLILISCMNKQDNFVISTGDVPVYYDVKGKGYPTLVFVHGWSRNRNDWNGQIDYFSQKHKVVRLDLAGHGESGSDRNNWSISAFSQDVIAVIEKLNLDRIVLIGHSLGAPVILETANHLPDRVLGIVPVDAFHNVEQKFTQDQIDNILAPYKSNFMEAYTNGARQMLSDSSMIEKAIQEIASFSPEIGVASLESCYHFLTNDLIPALRKVKVPIRCINSDIYPTNIDVARQYVSSFNVILMPGVGHEMQSADQKKFNQLLERILSEFN
jgi:pimeloyl-ACP methyl ester carboxylesterase